MPGIPSVVKSIELSLLLGHPLGQVLPTALGATLATLARSEGWRPVELSMMLNGYPGRVYSFRRDRIAELTGASRADIDRWIDIEAERRRKVAV
jgi:hypothetical protein